MSDGQTSTPGGGLDRRALAAVSVTVLAWASAFVAIRDAGRYFDPGALALGRLLAGSLVLAAVWLARGEGWPRRAAWPGIAGTGVLWFGVYMVTLNWGERHVDAGTAAMVVNIGPVVIALLGGWLLHEGFPRRLLAGLAVSFAGAVIVGLSESGGGGASLLGVGMCLLAAVSYATAAGTQYPRSLRCGPGVVPAILAENLELWTRPQPAGIRVSDAVAWAHEILARYAGYTDTSNNAQGVP